MTTIINKEIGSTSNISFKGLGHSGPFSFTVESGNIPTGIIYDPIKNELKGTFTKKEVFNFTIVGKNKNRIEGREDFSVNVSDWKLSKIDFKTDVDYNGQLWNKSGTVTKITNDPGLFDGECYEINPGGMTLTMPEAIGTRNFEIDLIVKPLTGSAANGRTWVSFDLRTP